MFSKLLNSLPVVGHLKAALHYASGDVSGGHEALFEATRSAAVMVGGALGAVGGPAGLAAGAVAAGAAADVFASGATGRATGVVAGVANVLADVISGELPVESTLVLALSVAGDAAGGYGGATVAGSITKTAGKVISKNVGEEIFKTAVKHEAVLRAAAGYCAARAVARGDRPQGGYRQSANYRSPSTPASGSDGGEPPHQPAGTKGSGENSDGSEPPKKPSGTRAAYDTTVTHWDAFLRLFAAGSLDEVRAGASGIQIFKNLEDGQRDSLRKAVGGLRRRGDAHLARVVAIVMQLLDKLDDSDVTFQNFLGLLQFVLVYVGELVAERTERRRGVGERNLAPFERRLEGALEEVVAELSRDVSAVWSKYKALRYEVSYHLTRLWPSFRNVVSAVYHYYKHRRPPERAADLTVEEYFDLIRPLVLRLRRLDQFSQLGVTRRELKFERFLAAFGRRLRIVFKVQGEDLELSTCYFVTVFIEGDEDGDEFVDGEKI